MERSVARRIPEHLAWEYEALALSVSGATVTVAFGSAPTAGALQRIERATGLSVDATSLPREHIHRELARIHGRAAAAPRTGSSDSPAIRAVNELHERAFYARCSDIHIEPAGTAAKVRFRIDGFLREMETLDDKLALAVVSRIKVLAAMDIAERRLPQDGRYTLVIAGHTIDARVSSVPAQDGEKLVIRLLDHQARLPSFDELGMSPAICEAFRRAIHAPHGFIVVCGPTGSGKTTSLYAGLRELNTADRNICTVEEPVEQAIGGLTQVQVNMRAGLTFASVLRALLRQDPNVIMIGEIRDAETANTAIAAALSGQLVFATLHSNDAPRAIERLSELQVARSSMAAGLTAILAQRLVRRLCPQCKRATSIDDGTADAYGIGHERNAFEPQGCDYCQGVGYYERLGIFELVVIDDAMRDAIAGGASSVTIARLARQAGYQSMAEDCLAKCRAGATSLGEYVRVAFTGLPR